MSETWTEYAVRHWSGDDELAESLSHARDIVNHFGGTIVGRTVTASDWLPVDTDGAK